MLYSRGVPMESLGIPTRDASAPAPRETRVRCGAPSRRTTTSSAARRPARGSTTSCTTCSASACSSRRHRAPRLRRDRREAPVVGVPPAGAVRPVQHRGPHHDRRANRHRSSTIRPSASRDGTARCLPCFRPDALFRIATPQWNAAIDA
jgi:hypothetical protein